MVNHYMTDNNAQELYGKVQEYINKLKEEEKVDYIILLTHIGMEIEEYTNNDLLSKINGVDIVLNGLTHKIYNTTSKD